jgi:phage anti-repressor protein
MSTYYPNEFLPENPDLGTPKTRNYFRNNLPFEETSGNPEQANVTANFGKKQDFLTASINNDKLLNKYETIVNKDDPNKNSKSNNSQKIRVTKVNIDSRLRNIQPKHILDTKLNNLQNALFFTENSNSIIVYHPNHNFIVEDKFILEFATSTNIKIKNGLFFEKGSTFAKINQTNHNMKDGNTYKIQISNVTGDVNSGTYILNYPINLINKTHTVYFRRTPTDQFDPNGYYIQLDIKAENEYTYQYSFNLSYLHIKNIALNQINANYPISSDRITGSHIIDSVINENFYSFSVESFADSSTLTTYNNTFYNSTPNNGDGNNIMIIKIINDISGYPNNNNYQINLQRNFYHVTQINLINTIFPITQKLVNATPISIQNNLFYWQNLADGDTLYSVSLPTGNYRMSDLAIALEKLINSIIRPNIDSTQLVNSIYTYNTNYSVVNVNPIQNTFSIEFYQNIILSNAIFKSKIVYPDGFTRILVTYTNHCLVAGNKLTFSNVLGTDSIPAEYLNGSFFVEQIIDANTFTIKLDRFNDDSSTTTNGGTAIKILVPIQARLLFNKPNTIGNVLGFNNVGDSNSVTSYSYVINNYDLYEIDIQENSIGVVTQPRVDTRVLSVNPNNYILMLADLPFNDQINLFNTSTFAFAKIYLAGEMNNYVYDQYIQLGSTFQEPLAALSTITLSFYGPDNNLYDFNNVEHSFTIEIIEQLDELNIVGFETG